MDGQAVAGPCRWPGSRHALIATAVIVAPGVEPAGVMLALGRLSSGPASATAQTAPAASPGLATASAQTSAPAHSVRCGKLPRTACRFAGSAGQRGEA